MPLTPEQKRVARRIYRTGRRVGARPREQLAALETGIVESGLRNLDYGDADSVGWRQERSHYGSVARRRNVAGGARRFFSETRAAGPQKYRTAGQLAADVQRPAAQYRGRYDQVEGEARQVLDWLRRTEGQAPSQHSRAAPGATRTRTVTQTPGVSNEALRKSLMLNYLESRGKPGGLLELASGLKQAQDIPGTREVSTTYKRGARARAKPSGPKKGAGTFAWKGKEKPSAYDIGLMAQRFGLRVGEHPGFDRVDPVHTATSYHYQRGEKGGRAVDISGDPAKLRRFYRQITRRYGSQLSEAFHDPEGYYYKNGKRIKGAIGGHGSHAHFAV